MTTTEPAPAGELRRPSTEQDPRWWRTAVVYQIYPRSFADGDGDGIGDLRGIITRLDHLTALGVDVIWLGPIFRSPHDDNGYDVSDYQDVDPVFGTLADLDELIAQVHRRGMKIILDLVVNHTSDEHPWFAESRSSTDNPKRDWYWWRPPRPGFAGGEPGAEPTNWRSYFSGPTWQWDEATGEYYLHLFSRKQPDLNWENPEVRQAVYAMMRWWVDRGVDGFRLDVINHLSKAVGPDGSLPDGPPVPGTPYGDGSAFYEGGPRLHEYLREMHREVFAGRGLLTVGEMPGVSIEQARRHSDPTADELSMVFTFEHVELDHVGTKWHRRPLALSELKANLASWQEGLADVGWNSLYWNNHDQPRAVSRFGDDSPSVRVASAKTLGTVLHLLRGTPYVYQGEELGMTNVEFAGVEEYRDIETLNHVREALALGRSVPEVLAAVRSISRDNARTPMQWDDGEHAGFTTGTPWIAVNPNFTEVNAAAAVADPDSVFHHYRRLHELRRTLPVVVDGRFTLLLPEHEQVFAYTRVLDAGARGGAGEAGPAEGGAGETDPAEGGAGEADALLVVANMSSSPLTVELEEAGDLLHGQVLLATHPDSAPPRGSELSLEPWESRVLRRLG